MTQPTLQQRFATWCANASKNHLAEQPYPATLQGSKQMLESALWQAYAQGYRQCQADATAAIAGLRQGD